MTLGGGCEALHHEPSLDQAHSGPEESRGEDNAAEPRHTDRRDGERRATQQRLLDLVLPHLPRLRRYLACRVPLDDVEDVTQETLLRMFGRIDSEPMRHPKSYLFQTAHSVVIDRHRRELSRCAFLHCELSDDNHPSDDLSPLRILLAREDTHAVELALHQMPARTREILIARRLEGWSLKSLARRYNVSTSAIEKHVTRALKELRVPRDSNARPWLAQAATPRGLDHV